MISHIVSVEGGNSRSPTLSLSKKAFSGIQSHFCCGEFFGGIRFINFDESESLVVVNGLVYAIIDGKVKITSDLRVSPSPDFLSQHLTDLQFSLVAAEARLNFLLSNPASEKHDVCLALMHRYLLWLSGACGKNVTNNDIIALQARALYLDKFIAKPAKSVGIPVPYLKYDAYSNMVNSVQEVIKTASVQLTSFQTKIRERKAEEHEIDREKHLNENMIQSGKLLSDYVSTQAKYQ